MSTLTPEEHKRVLDRLQELVWLNEARAGRPKEYHARLQTLRAFLEPECDEHHMDSCLVCFADRVRGVTLLECAGVARKAEDLMLPDCRKALYIARQIEDRIKETKQPKP